MCCLNYFRQSLGWYLLGYFIVVLKIILKHIYNRKQYIRRKFCSLNRAFIDRSDGISYRQMQKWCAFISFVIVPSKIRLLIIWMIFFTWSLSSGPLISAAIANTFKYSFLAWLERSWVSDIRFINSGSC